MNPENIIALAEQNEEANALTSFGWARIDANGGDFRAGMISGVSLMERGPARGWGFFIDQTMISQVHAAMAESLALKVRFDHPSPDGSRTGTGRLVAHAKNPRLSADREAVLADLHLVNSAKKSPEGDLNSYVLAVSEETPESLGLSAFFLRDRKAELEFMLAHGGVIVTDQETGAQSLRGFRSPDPENVDNLPHVRLAKLSAADIVDSPGATSGLFREEAEKVAAYLSGKTNEPPQGDFSWDRMKTALAVGQLQLVALSERNDMDPTPSNTAPPASDPPATDPTPAPEPTNDPPADPPADPEPASDPPAEPPAEPDPPANPEPVSDPAADPEGKTVALSEIQRYTTAFGPEGATWLSEGLTFEECQAKKLELVTAENARLKSALGESRGEDDPVSLSDINTEGVPAKKLDSPEVMLGENLGRFASGLQIPGASQN